MNDEWDLILGGDVSEELGGEWYCNECEFGPLEEEEIRCSRCGHKHSMAPAEEMELDENGDPVDQEHYEEHY